MRLILMLCMVAIVLAAVVYGTILYGFGGGFFLGLVGMLLTVPFGVVLLIVEAVYQVRQDRVDLEAAQARVDAEDKAYADYVTQSAATSNLKGTGDVKGAMEGISREEVLEKKSAEVLKEIREEVLKEIPEENIEKIMGDVLSEDEGASIYGFVENQDMERQAMDEKNNQ